MICWIFDVDGVITDLYSKKVEYPQILHKISEKLLNGEPVGIITGRTLSKLLENIIKPIEEIAKDKNKLRLLHAEGEFGAASMGFENGELEISYDEVFSLPNELVVKGEQIINNYQDIVFFDQKKSFFTAEMKSGSDIQVFRDKQPEIAEKLKLLVSEFGLSSSLEIHQDTIAVNVKNKKLNKHLAADKFLKWLQSKNLNPGLYLVFGDSTSDLQIAEELHAQGKNVKFIHTGTNDLGEQSFEVIKTIAKFDKGTLEYLTSN